MTSVPYCSSVAKGDEIAFSCFFDLYRPNIYTTVLRITKDEWLTEEILQNTFVKTWISREALTGVNSPFPITLLSFPNSSK